MHTLSPAQAGQLATRARRLRREGRLTQHQYGLLDALLWQARKPGSATLLASMRVLALLAGQARSTVIEGVRRLEELGLIQRIKRRARVAWGGSIASRVIANGYRLVPPQHRDRRAVGKRSAFHYLYCRGADRRDARGSRGPRRTAAGDGRKAHEGE